MFLFLPCFVLVMCFYTLLKSLEITFKRKDRITFENYGFIIKAYGIWLPCTEGFMYKIKYFPDFWNLLPDLYQIQYVIVPLYFCWNKRTTLEMLHTRGRIIPHGVFDISQEEPGTPPSPCFIPSTNFQSMFLDDSRASHMSPRKKDFHFDMSKLSYLLRLTLAISLFC